MELAIHDRYHHRAAKILEEISHFGERRFPGKVLRRVIGFHLENASAFGSYPDFRG